MGATFSSSSSTSTSSSSSSSSSAPELGQDELNFKLYLRERGLEVTDSSLCAGDLGDLFRSAVEQKRYVAARAFATLLRRGELSPYPGAAGPDPQLVREIILRHRGAALDDAWGRAETFLASWADGGRDWNRDQDQVAALPGGGKLGTIVLKEPQNPLRRGARRRATSLLSGLIDGDPHDGSPPSLDQAKRAGMHVLKVLDLNNGSHTYFEDIVSFLSVAVLKQRRFLELVVAQEQEEAATSRSRAGAAAGAAGAGAGAGAGAERGGRGNKRRRSDGGAASSAAGGAGGIIGSSMSSEVLREEFLNEMVRRRREGEGVGAGVGVGVLCVCACVCVHGCTCVYVCVHACVCACP